MTKTKQAVSSLLIFMGLISSQLALAGSTQTLFPMSLTGYKTASYIMDANLDSQGDLVSFHFYGSGKDRVIPLESFTDGNIASDLIHAPVVGNVIWVSADSEFTAKNGGNVTITYLSSGGIFGLYKSEFHVRIIRSGKKWIPEVIDNHNALLRGILVNAAVQGLGFKATFQAE